VPSSKATNLRDGDWPREGAAIIHIRKATAADAEAMSEIVIASIRDLCAADHKNSPARIGSWTANKTPENFRHWIASGETLLFIAEHDGEPAAVGGLGLDGTIRLNYVAPAHRWQRVSRTLLAHMENVLRNAGIKVGRLRSSETAFAFYLSAGWVEDDQVILLAGQEGRAMRKSLRTSSD
jgi:GNAT superfamily N-acetyltransferase